MFKKPMQICGWRGVRHESKEIYSRLQLKSTKKFASYGRFRDQWELLKHENPNFILFFRNGKFYEVCLYIFPTFLKETIENPWEFVVC